VHWLPARLDARESRRLSCHIQVVDVEVCGQQFWSRHRRTAAPATASATLHVQRRLGKLVGPFATALSAVLLFHPCLANSSSMALVLSKRTLGITGNASVSSTGTSSQVLLHFQSGTWRRAWWSGVCGFACSGSAGRSCCRGLCTRHLGKAGRDPCSTAAVPVRLGRGMFPVQSYCWPRAFCCTSPLMLIVQCAGVAEQLHWLCTTCLGASSRSN
jgi:hypothetical protein